MDLGAGPGMTRGEREQVGVFDAGLLAVPGLEALREIHAGRSPQPPIHYWSGRRLVALQHGEASIAVPASGWFCGPKGRLHSGIFAFLLDMAHLYAVVSTLPAGGACTTAELSVTVLGEPPPSGAEITGRSRVIYSDERNALAEGLVVDQGGQPLAHSTSRYFLFAPGAVVPRSGGGSPPGMPLPGTAAMLQEPVPQIAPVGPELLQRLSGLDILAAQLKGEIPAAPIDRYAGIRLMEAQDGRVVFSLPAHPVPLEYSIAWLTCAVVSILDAVMVGWPGAAQDRLPASSPDARAWLSCPGERHPCAVLTEYQAHYITARPHQGIAQRVPDDERRAPCTTATDVDPQQVRRKPSWSPDQRVPARRLTYERPAGNLPNPISSGTGWDTSSCV